MRLQTPNPKLLNPNPNLKKTETLPLTKETETLKSNSGSEEAMRLSEGHPGIRGDLDRAAAPRPAL